MRHALFAAAVVALSGCGASFSWLGDFTVAVGSGSAELRCEP